MDIKIERTSRLSRQLDYIWITSGLHRYPDVQLDKGRRYYYIILKHSLVTLEREIRKKTSLSYRIFLQDNKEDLKNPPDLTLPRSQHPQQHPYPHPPKPPKGQDLQESPKLDSHE